jgi:hypothetical protein
MHHTYECFYLLHANSRDISASWHRGCVRPVWAHKIREAAKEHLGAVSQESYHSINEHEPGVFDH